MPRFMYCKSCGWFEGPLPDDLIRAAPGGTPSCPVCRHKRENPGLSSSFGRVTGIDVAGWEPEIWRLQQLFDFYYACPTVADIDKYIHDKNRERGYVPLKETELEMRQFILDLFSKIKRYNTLRPTIKENEK